MCSKVQMISPEEALQNAINIAGGQTALATLLDSELDSVKQQNVWQWLNRDKKASAKWVAKISEVTGVSCHELRPDIFPEAANDPSIQQDLA